MASTGVVRPPAVAGTFYPADPGLLERVIGRLLSAVRSEPCPRPKALIVPHAGYVYSGPVAASAYACLEEPTSAVERVVLLGPAHFVRIVRPALSGADAFLTPLGEVPVDRDAERSIEDLVEVSQAAHAPEHSLEVQLPFLQLVLEALTVVPVLLGRAGERAAESVLDRLYGGPETLLVISTDLSHYQPLDRARKLDAETATAIRALDADAVTDDRACGASAVRALLRLARRRGLTVTGLDLRTSADTAGPAESVVGYGAFALS